MLSIQERNPNTIQNPEADTKILFNDATDGKLKTKDSAGTIEEVALVDATAPKVYIALLTQTGTNAPVATVLQNTLGGTVVWSYETIGIYTATLNGAFTEGKVFTNISNDVRGEDDYIIERSLTWVTADAVRLTTVYIDYSTPTEAVFAPENGHLNNIIIKIEVYP